MGKKNTGLDKEMQILAMVVRGDTRQQIADEFGLNIATIDKIKGRHKDTLAIMQEKLVQHRISQAARILDKANKGIESEVDSHNTGEKPLSVTELVSVSKEMSNQIKQDKEQAPINPESQQKRLEALTKAIEAGDHITLERLIFNSPVQEAEAVDIT